LTSGTQSQQYALVLQCYYRLYLWRSAADATVSDLPDGLTSVSTANKTVTISGTPTASVPIHNNFRTYYCTAATISGTVTRNLASTIVLTSGTQNQRYALVLQLHGLHSWRKRN
jgi:hypothetical protein